MKQATKLIAAAGALVGGLLIAKVASADDDDEASIETYEDRVRFAQTCTIDVDFIERTAAEARDRGDEQTAAKLYYGAAVLRNATPEQKAEILKRIGNNPACGAPVEG